jgi:NTP pyrophosphatase (non-canonical NTP hydrolase)
MNPADHLSYIGEHPQIKNKGSNTHKPTMGELVAHVEQWAIIRGLDSREHQSRQALKVMEEVGETMAAMARGDKEKLKDGIGDSIVTLIILAMQCGLDARSCLESAYDEIKNRKGKTVDGIFIKE